MKSLAKSSGFIVPMVGERPRPLACPLICTAGAAQKTGLFNGGNLGVNAGKCMEQYHIEITFEHIWEGLLIGFTIEKWRC